MVIQNILAVILSFSFLFYGINCIYSIKMIEEFKRFGIPQYRVLTGVLQILAAVGILVGFKVPLFAIISSFGLIVLMTMGFVVRLIIKDNWLQSAPSIIFAIISLAYFILLIN